MSIKLPSRRLVSQDDHAMTARPDVPRSKFSGSWTRKTSFDAGLLVPFMVEEVLPGDHLQYDVTAMVRMATPLFPVFDNQRIDTFFFFVANRLVWDNWVKFMGEQDSPSDTIAYTIPQLVTAAGGFPDNSLADHFGIPCARQVPNADTMSVNALPFRAYNLIYNEWFKDQNLINAASVPTGDTGDLVAMYGIQRRAKSHDYFTSALPWPQKFVAPTIPLSGNAPVRGAGFTPTATGVASPALMGTDLVSIPGGYGLYYAGAGSDWYVDSATGMYADLAVAAGITVTTLRQSFLVQQLLERDARGGTRYTELVRAHFGVVSPDARQQRAEYIAGGSTALQVTTIAQTAPTAGATLGALGGVGTAAGAHRASYAATEHGYIIGIINVKSELSYGQGLHKMWSRSTRYDFYWPALAGLGEQAVLVKELYYRGAATNAQVFGYQERWHEYRTRYSEVAGEFRSGTDAAAPLAPWILSQRLTAVPTLGQTFIEDTPPMATVLAAGALAANQQYLADILIRRVAVRPIPTFGTPVSLGRF